MTDNQEKHLARVKNRFCLLVDAKYRRGAEEHADEHGGELLNAPSVYILELAIEEAIDQVVYLLSLREKLLREVEP